ncbi:hypothetical protein PT974_06662 [Cladobotryum mycophilum]|uniref:Uncharacterized protein n=1 Tax=Cladobotryum mycophilum TaxID=491253 RepID=A0ABR0SM92_9HYPO
MGEIHLKAEEKRRSSAVIPTLAINAYRGYHPMGAGISATSTLASVSASTESEIPEQVVRDNRRTEIESH